MDGEQPQGAGSPEQMVQQVADGLGVLAQSAAQSNPELAQGLQALQQQFMQLIESAIQQMQGGGGQGGVRPVQDQSQGMPAGPQGAM